MLLRWYQLTIWLTSFKLICISAICPPPCVCKQTDRGKRQVSCFGGGLQEIPATEMDPGMEILDISAPDNKWNALSITTVFQNFKHLEELRLRKCSIQQIGVHTFWGVPSLKLLDLSVNNLSAVSEHNFRGLVNLVELKLDDNRIVSLQSGVFKHLTELRILTVQRNLLEELESRTFLKLGKLHVLKLNGNKFEELDPEAFKDIPELRVLECRNCGLKRINTQIYHLLPYLSHLDLGNNRMQFLSYDEFNDLHKLHSLKLDGNQLPVILEKTFVNQQQLRYLCLARNRLAKITNTAFLNLTSLIELDISHNKLSKMEALAMQHISETLQKLRISGNNFNSAVIRTILHTTYKVWDLNLAQLGITELPRGFLPDRIRKLNISNNNISELQLAALPKQLMEIDLSRNKLKGLDEKLVLKLENLKKVNLAGNPWSCDLCHITAMLFRVNKTGLFKNLSCSFPGQLKGRQLGNLRLEDVSTCKNSDEIAEEGDFSSGSTRLGLVVGVSTLVLFFIFSLIFTICLCTRRQVRNARERSKRERERECTSLDNSVAVFCKGEISFKFPLDLTERKVSVCTIDEIKREAQLPNLPNGTGTGI